MCWQQLVGVLLEISTVPASTVEFVGNGLIHELLISMEVFESRQGSLLP